VFFISFGILKFTLIINGIILLFNYFFTKPKRGINSLGLMNALGFGVVQALAILPGISRSGITISYLTFNKLNKEEAFKLSFLAGLPAILGAFILEAKINYSNLLGLKGFLFCMLISFLSGIFSLFILKRFLLKEKFYYFGYYCILMGVLLFFIR